MMNNSAREEKTANNSVRSGARGWVAVLVFAAAYAVFAVILTFGDYQLSGDSYDYLVLGRNLARGEGYTRLGLPEYFRPPGYPFLVALGTAFFNDLELTGHLISLIAGVLAVPAAYWAARGVLSVRYSVLSAALLAFNPFFIDSGATALSETSNALFAVIAVGFLLRALSRASRGAVFYAACFGFFSAAAYLCRTESVLLFVCGLGLLLWGLRREMMRGALCAAVALVVLAAVCFPYWLNQCNAAGHITFNGNSVNLIWYQSDIGERPPASLDPRWAPHPFDPFLPRATRPQDFQPLRYVMLNVPELAKRWAVNAASYLVPAGALLFFGLGFVPLVLGLRGARRHMNGCAFGALLAAFVPIVVLFFRSGTERLLVPYLPAASILMAIGLPSVNGWLLNRIRFRKFSANTANFVLIFLMALSPAIKFARHIGREENKTRDFYRSVGAAIQHHNGSDALPVVMAEHKAPGFHAGGRTVAIPDTDDYSRLIEQMDRFNAEFLVIRRDDDAQNHPILIKTLQTPQVLWELKHIGTYKGDIDLYVRVKGG